MFSVCGVKWWISLNSEHTKTKHLEFLASILGCELLIINFVGSVENWPDCRDCPEKLIRSANTNNFYHMRKIYCYQCAYTIHIPHTHARIHKTGTIFPYKIYHRTSIAAAELWSTGEAAFERHYSDSSNIQ